MKRNESGSRTNRLLMQSPVLVISAMLLFSSCASTQPSSGTAGKQGGETLATQSVEAQASTYFSSFDVEDTYEKVSATVTMRDGGCTSDKTDGVTVTGNTVTIGAVGTYVFTGNCQDGQIVVNVSKEEKVHLVFDNLTLSNANSAPVNLLSADKVTITLAADTVNTLSDAAETDSVADRPSACLFSQDDLSINGTGTLHINGNFNNGIASKDDLRIVSGTITVNAKNNGVKGNDSVVIKGGTVEINSDDDGIKSENEIDEGKGIVNIYGGSIHVTCGDDGIQAPVSVTIAAGSVSVNAGGQMVNAPASSIADGCMTR